MKNGFLMFILLIINLRTYIYVKCYQFSTWFFLKPVINQIIITWIITFTKRFISYIICLRIC